MDNENEKLKKGFMSGLKVVGKALLLGAVIAVGGAVAGGFIASAAGLGGLGIAGGVFLGLVVGTFGGVAAGGAYVASKAAPAVKAVGEFIDEANKELVAQGQQPVVIEGLTKKFDNAATAEKPAVAVEPIVAAPAAVAPAAPKAPAQ
ncbi:MAG: hypothetical protein IT560_05550 [Alphaproteobacteria bacterium]|nr:hypothetical protein [Alphaproteobacteria bacterium]